MSKAGIIIVSVLFGSMLVVEVFLLREPEVKSEELVSVSGLISNVSCPTSKFSSKPKITLVVNKLEKKFSLFQVFSEKLSCNGKDSENSLIGSTAILKVLPNKSEFAWAYEVYINNKLIYGVAEARSESKSTGLILILVSIVSLFFGLLKRPKNT